MRGWRSRRMNQNDLFEHSRGGGGSLLYRRRSVMYKFETVYLEKP